jgi:hypothetical protein
MKFPRCLAASEIAALDAARTLIQDSFSYMEPRIDPPSFVRQLTLEAMVQHCQTGEIWCLGTPVSACVFLTPRADGLYLGKLAVAEARRGTGV